MLLLLLLFILKIMDKILCWYKSQRNNDQLRYGNRIYNKKIRSDRKKSDTSNEYRCATGGCYASIFLALTFLTGGQCVITQPLEIARINDKHSENCKERSETWFTNKEQLALVKNGIEHDTKLQSLWEKNRNDYKSTNPGIVLKDYKSVIFFE